MEKTMSKEDGIKIAKDLLSVISKLLRHIPICCVSVVDKKQTVKDLYIVSNLNKVKINRIYSLSTIEFEETPRCTFILDGRHFEISFYDNPEDAGNYSLLADYNKETYVFCAISEKRPSGNTKYEMSFGFDVEKMTFLELFDLYHYPDISNCVRRPNYDDMLEIESTLKCYTIK